MGFNTSLRPLTFRQGGGQGVTREMGVGWVDGSTSASWIEVLGAGRVYS